ncbi:hypothetical protein DM860_006915 [Cuscuta australis]|uniref:DUF4228 domain-containing protein n=1 Tax=Cuscuta australis TaxID=267555 RepID=A0A328E9L7_9ASTE|nr:hypothetical protein DM860_006915 [Cuscuta australis]
MGNCQAVDAAALVVQHPGGKIERRYSPITASEVMKSNPGHYVCLIIPLPVAGDGNSGNRLSTVKLLKPTETLVLGRAYRLLTTQEVGKVLRDKKHKKMKTDSHKEQSEGCEMEGEIDEEINNPSQGMRHRQRSGPRKPGAERSNKSSWRPSLLSISESLS